MREYGGVVRVVSARRPAMTGCGAALAVRAVVEHPHLVLLCATRVECAEHGVVVEHIPWSDGKRPVTCAMMRFLARWARRLSWRETARVFQTSWEAVYRRVEWFVQRGLTHRQLSGVESIGADKIHWGHGLRVDNFLTVIYAGECGSDGKMG